MSYPQSSSSESAVGPQQTGFVSPSTYGGIAGFSSTPAFGTVPGFGSPSAFGGRRNKMSYPTQPGGYPQSSSSESAGYSSAVGPEQAVPFGTGLSSPQFGANPAFGAGPGFGSPSAFGGNPGFGSTPAFGTGPGFGSPSTFGGNPGFGSTVAFGTATGAGISQNQRRAGIAGYTCLSIFCVCLFVAPALWIIGFGIWLCATNGGHGYK